MRSIGLLAIAVLSAPALACAAGPMRAEVPVQLTVPFAHIDRVSVDTFNGLIQVTCDPAKKSIDIAAVKDARGKTVEEARRVAERIELTAVPDPAAPTTLAIFAKSPQEDRDHNPGCDLHITLPPNAALKLVTANGLLSVTGAGKGVQAETRNGNATVHHVVGDVVIKAANGDVVVNDVNGDADIHASNGEVTLGRVGRTRVAAVARNGKIVATGIVGDAALSADNGEIELRLASVSAHPKIEAISRNGEVLVEVPSTLSAKLTAKSAQGAIELKTPNVITKDRHSTPGRTTATLNGGAGDLRVESSNGSVTIQSTGATKPL